MRPEQHGSISMYGKRSPTPPKPRIAYPDEPLALEFANHTVHDPIRNLIQLLLDLLPSLL